MRLTVSILGLCAALALSAQATGFLATNAYLVAKDQTIGNEQWVVANTAETAGTFQNDLFIASGTDLLLNGSYEGNVWGAAGLGTTLDGNCRRNVRLTGQTIRINGTIDGNLMAMANTIVIGTKATIQGNVRLIGTSIVQEGTIQGNVTISAARLATLGGTIHGNAKVIAPEILLPDAARILGDLAYTANTELIPADGVVAGKLERVIPKTPPLFSAGRIKSQTIWFVAAFLAGVPFIALFPMTTAMASLLARKKPLKCLVVGFLASGALPVAGLVCVSSLVGIPLGVLILASWGILVYLSRIIMALVIGTLLLRSESASIGRVLLAMSIGLSVFYLATLVPSVGLPVQIAIVWMGMGALLLAQMQKRRLIIQIPEELKHLEELKNERKKTTEESP